jgi:hypothetical protein
VDSSVSGTGLWRLPAHIITAGGKKINSYIGVIPFDNHVLLVPPNPVYRPMINRPDEVRMLGKLRIVVQHRV